jgi:hypothetical protein
VKVAEPAGERVPSLTLPERLPSVGAIDAPAGRPYTTRVEHLFAERGGGDEAR